MISCPLMVDGIKFSHTWLVYGGEGGVRVRGHPGGGGGVLPYMGYIGMCRGIGYGF